MPKAGGRWNTLEITAKGSQLTVTFNGIRTADIQDSKHARGPFALQYSAGIVNFPRYSSNRYSLRQPTRELLIVDARFFSAL